jgi:hypothetical protein
MVRNRSSARTIAWLLALLGLLTALPGLAQTQPAKEAPAAKGLSAAAESKEPRAGHGLRRRAGRRPRRPVQPNHAALQIAAAPTMLGPIVSGKGFCSAWGYSVSGGLRKGKVDLFLLLEHDLWFDRDWGRAAIPGVLNFGGGLALLYFKQRMRSSAAIGLSALLFEGDTEARGATGLFLELRPAGVRWPLRGGKLAVELHPISLMLEVPSVERVPIVRVSFRTTLALEIVR